ncbi:uncharacterized protein LOC128177913 [Crassostrea angulata]|uniref:uncharacterized protein LOC128177913 n=1 Tax=Magallana angulata TaxID=2784310 RepID=UPI0022B18BD8|nr:uncharacterized protein LOC128177913 [Crassostrea angulata]
MPCRHLYWFGWNYTLRKFNEHLRPGLQSMSMANNLTLKRTMIKIKKIEDSTVFTMKLVFVTIVLSLLCSQICVSNASNGSKLFPEIKISWIEALTELMPRDSAQNNFRNKLLQVLNRILEKQHKSYEPKWRIRRFK